MIDMTDIKAVKALQSNLHAIFDGPAGKEVMLFLDQICGWYDFSTQERDAILIGHGKRQVLATIKTLLELSPEAVRQLAINLQGE